MNFNDEFYNFEITEEGKIIELKDKKDYVLEEEKTDDSIDNKKEVSEKVKEIKIEVIEGNNYFENYKIEPLFGGNLVWYRNRTLYYVKNKKDYYLISKDIDSIDKEKIPDYKEHKEVYDSNKNIIVIKNKDEEKILSLIELSKLFKDYENTLYALDKEVFLTLSDYMRWDSHSKSLHCVQMNYNGLILNYLKDDERGKYLFKKINEVLVDFGKSEKDVIQNDIDHVGVTFLNGE